MSSVETDATRATTEFLQISWNAESRVATLQFLAGAMLGAREGACMVESLTRWIGEEGKPFALLSKLKGVRGADAQYRVQTKDFFKQYRNQAFVAVVDMGPVIRIVAEMFRIGTGVQLKGFASEAGARAWLRGHGFIL
jgi:hypothetical protein